jgi:hypothetical protein
MISSLGYENEVANDRLNAYNLLRAEVEALTAALAAKQAESDAAYAAFVDAIDLVPGHQSGSKNAAVMLSNDNQTATVEYPFGGEGDLPYAGATGEVFHRNDRHCIGFEVACEGEPEDNEVVVGFCNGAFNSAADDPCNSPDAWAYKSNGEVWHNGNVVSTRAPFSSGDIPLGLTDHEDGKGWFGVDTIDGDPEAGEDAAFTFAPSTILRPIDGLNPQSGSASVTLKMSVSYGETFAPWGSQ